MRQERNNEQAQIIHHHSSYKQAVFTMALLPVPTCQHFTENKATVNHKYCHVEQFIMFVSRFIPSAKSSNWIKKYWIIKMKNYTALKRGFKFLWLHSVYKSISAHVDTSLRKFRGGKKRSSSEISDDKLTFLYIALDFQGFKTGLTAVVQMDIFTVLIHCVQFKFIKLNTLQEDFIFYLHLPVLSDTLLFIKHENHKRGWDLPF